MVIESVPAPKPDVAPLVGIPLVFTFRVVTTPRLELLDSLKKITVTSSLALYVAPKLATGLLFAFQIRVSAA